MQQVRRIKALQPEGRKRKRPSNGAAGRHCHSIEHSKPEAALMSLVPSLTNPVAAQAISRFALQGNSALLRSDFDGPLKFSFGFFALTD